MNQLTKVVRHKTLNKWFAVNEELNENTDTSKYVWVSGGVLQLDSKKGIILVSDNNFLFFRDELEEFV